MIPNTPTPLALNIDREQYLMHCAPFIERATILVLQKQTFQSTIETINNAISAIFKEYIFPMQFLAISAGSNKTRHFKKIKKYHPHQDKIPFNISCLIHDNRIKIILNTKKTIDTGSYNKISATVEIYLPNSKDVKTIEIREGIQRKKIHKVAYEQIHSLHSAIAKVRYMFRDIPNVCIPALPFFLKTSHNLFRMVTYERFLEISLFEQINKGKITKQEMKAIFLCCIDSLFAMRKGKNYDEIIIHGDIKADNIMLKKDEQRKIIACRLIDMDGSAQGQVPSTFSPACNPPLFFFCQAQRKHNVNQDIFCLLITMFATEYPQIADPFLCALKSINVNLRIELEEVSSLSEMEQVFFASRNRFDLLVQTIENPYYASALRAAANLPFNDIAAGSMFLQQIKRYVAQNLS